MKNQKEISGLTVLKIDADPVKRPCVLVVDDNPYIRRAMELMLAGEFDVTVSASGFDASELVKGGKDFDVVSLDLKMPGLSGTEALKLIKQTSPSTEILIVTAHSDIESAREALKLGAYDYIDKPFKKDDFRAAIRKGVERKSRNLVSLKAREQLLFVKAQLIQSEKFAAIGEMLSGIVHDLNNPLTVIMSLSELLLLKEFPAEKTRDYLLKMKASAELCKSIASKLLAFSRKPDTKRELVHVNKVAASTLELKQHDFKMDDINVVTRLAGDIPLTMANFYELQQVFLNIVTNAHQAMKEHHKKGILTVESTSDDRVIRISFRDNGPGIPGENLQKIFEPLFTTKGRGRGTGLGLSVCCEIMRQHGGDIYVSSELGKGTCFVTELPILAPPESADERYTACAEEESQ